MLMRLLALIILSFLFAGCVVSATEEGIAVRVIDKQNDYICNYVREVTGYGTASAMIQIKNRAAKAGANAVRVNYADYIANEAGSPIVIAEALNCEFED